MNQGIDEGKVSGGQRKMGLNQVVMTGGQRGMGCGGLACVELRDGAEAGRCEGQVWRAVRGEGKGGTDKLERVD